MFIAISLMLFIIIAFAIGITVFRQTKAIWSMTSTNAITINCTLNTFGYIEPLLIVIILATALVCVGTINRGFG